ncbi:hypothetical protein AN218_29035, partial [Streptomyces nanshensis]
HDAERRTAEALGAEERLAELLGLPHTGPHGVRASAVPSPRGSRTAKGGTGVAEHDGSGASAGSAQDGDAEHGSHTEDGAPGSGNPLTAAELDAGGESLAELLDQAVAACERQLFDLRTAAAEDSRMLGALGDGGLLPPAPDVTATVDFLGEHGIPALPGWRYLAQAVDPADHAAVLAARPELVDGVVITDPDSHVRAQEALAGAALLPRSAVAVGTAAALLAPFPREGESRDDVFLVPPNPAMHDEHAADEERRQVRARALARDEKIRGL